MFRLERCRGHVGGSPTSIWHRRRRCARRGQHRGGVDGDVVCVKAGVVRGRVVDAAPGDVIASLRVSPDAVLVTRRAIRVGPRSSTSSESCAQPPFSNQRLYAPSAAVRRVRSSTMRGGPSPSRSTSRTVRSYRRVLGGAVSRRAITQPTPNAPAATSPAPSATRRITNCPPSWPTRPPGEAVVRVALVSSPRRWLSARFSRARSAALMSKVTRGSIIASRISTISRCRRLSRSSALAASGSAWLSPGRTRDARFQRGSNCVARPTVRFRRMSCCARRTTGCAAKPRIGRGTRVERAVRRRVGRRA